MKKPEPELNIDFSEPTEPEDDSLPKPARMEVAAQNIPQELLKGKKWIVWKWAKRNGKWTKPPYTVTGKPAKSNDPATWATFAAALKAYESGKYAGIGYMIGQDDALCGIDFDDCHDPASGETTHEIWNHIKELDSYTELSPSGRGFKTLLKGELPQGGHHGERVGVFDSGRYFCITGQRIDATSPNIESRQDELNRLVKHYWPQDFEPAQKTPESPQACHSSLDDQELIQKALKAKDGGKFRQLWEGDMSGYPSHSEADQALCNKLAFWCGNDLARIDTLFRRSSLMRNKWERENYRQRTIEKAVAQTTETYKQRQQHNTRGKKLEFPSWVMTGIAGDFANLYSSYLEVPAHFFYMAFLTCLGSVVAHTLTLASEIAPEPRLFVLLLGESADDRKSTALNKVVDFFKWCVDDFAVCWGVGSAEGLQKRLEDSNRLLLCFDEFKQFISKCKIEASVLLPCVNTLFESNRYESRTKKTDIYLNDVYLTLMAASTLDTYENTWSSQFTDIGFNNRLFLIPGSGERKHSFPAKIPDRDKYLLKQRLGGILDHVGTGRELDLTQDARKAYHNWYMGLEKSIYTKRLDVYALRLMSLLSVNELKTEVDIDVVQKVIALCDWQFSVRALHDPIDADNAIAGMEEKIRRTLKNRGSLQERKLKQYTNAARTGLWAYNMARKNLMAHGEVGFNRKEKAYFLRQNSEM